MNTNMFQNNKSEDVSIETIIDFVNQNLNKQVHSSQNIPAFICGYETDDGSIIIGFEDDHNGWGYPTLESDVILVPYKSYWYENYNFIKELV